MLKTCCHTKKKRLFRWIFVEKDALKRRNKTSILHETVLAVAQTEQFAATKEEENLVVPDEFPQDAAHLHLFLGSQFLTGDDHALGSFHLVLLKGNLNKLVAQVDEGDAGGVVAAVHNHVDSVSHFLCVVKEMYGICVVVHIFSNLIDGANIGNFLKRASWRTKIPNFFHTYINMSFRFLTFALANQAKWLLNYWSFGLSALCHSLRFGRFCSKSSNGLASGNRRMRRLTRRPIRWKLNPNHNHVSGEIYPIFNRFRPKTT